MIHAHLEQDPAPHGDCRTPPDVSAFACLERSWPAAGRANVDSMVTVVMMLIGVGCGGLVLGICIEWG